MKLSEEEIWLQMWIAAASASNCTRSSVATNWADSGLKEFKERFRKPESESSFNLRSA